MRKIICTLACGLIFIFGCVDNKPTQTQAPVVATGPHIVVPQIPTISTVQPLPPQPAGTFSSAVSPDNSLTELHNKISQEIKASTETTQNQMNGLVTASISKLETNVKDLLHIETDALVKANLQLSNKIDLSISNQATVNATLQAKVEALANATVAGQAGLENNFKQQIDNIRVSSGHDTNYLPKEAVQVMISQTENERNVIAIVCGLFSTIVTVLGGGMVLNARSREKMNNDLLLKMAAELQPDKAKEIIVKAFPKSPLFNS